MLERLHTGPGYPSPDRETRKHTLRAENTATSHGKLELVEFAIGTNVTRVLITRSFTKLLPVHWIRKSVVTTCSGAYKMDLKPSALLRARTKEWFAGTDY